MKKIVKIMSIIMPLLLMVFMTGCDDEFLEKNPHAELSNATFWKTKKDADLALTSCYNTLFSNPLFSSRNPDWDGLTDNSWDREGGYLGIARGPLNSSTGGQVSSMYYASYGAIARVNDFLFNIENVEMSEDEKTTMIAQVRFFRALNYFYLAQLYGGVPLITEPYNIGDELLPRASKEAVTAQVIQDVDFAIQNLDYEIYNGKVGKAAAQLLKVRALMADENWSEAAAVSRTIMSSVHELTDNFKLMFTKAGQENNPEILFSTRYLAPNVTHVNPMAYGWWNPMNPYQSFVDQFECTDGLSIIDSPLYDPLNPYDNRDPRLFYTIVTPDAEWNAFLPSWPTFDKDLHPELAGASSTGFIVRKIWDFERTERATALFFIGEADMVLMRYAEALLSLAEAENELSGPTAEVLDAINQVRARTGVDMPPIAGGLSKDEMRDKIRHERRIEFAFEIGMRYFDLKRWKTAETVLNNFEGVGGIQYKFEPHNYLWPIPQAEIDYYKNNGSDYGQNPGYN